MVGAGLLVMLAAAVAASQAMSLVTVPASVADSYGAKCLDGSLPTYYIRRNSSSSSWILFLEGGGWCYGSTPNDTIASCAARAGLVPLDAASDAGIAANSRAHAAGRSFSVSDSDTDFGGVLSSNASVNPDFYTWNAVFLSYCDGASFAGLRSEPVPVHTKAGAPASLWLRGRANFDAILAHLRTAQNMSGATEVVLSGGSAGGLAVFYNLDHLAALLPAGVRLTGFPDAGFFLDAPNVQGERWYRQQFQGADPIWNVTGAGTTNAACLAHYPTDEAWRCLMAPYILPFVQTPIFIMNSAYDAYQLSHILQDNCVPTPTLPCNDTQLQAYGVLFKATLAAALSASPAAETSGAYVDSCYVHEQNVNYCSTQAMPNCVGWAPSCSGSIKWGYKTQVASRTPQQAFGDYYFGRGAASRTTIDPVAFQHNPSCPYLGHPVV